MKNVILYIAIGAVAGYAFRRCQEEKFFEKMYRNINLLSLKVRRELQKNKTDKTESVSKSLNTDDRSHNPENRDNDVLNEISY